MSGKPYISVKSATRNAACAPTSTARTDRRSTAAAGRAQECRRGRDPHAAAEEPREEAVAGMPDRPDAPEPDALVSEPPADGVDDPDVLDLDLDAMPGARTAGAVAEPLQAEVLPQAFLMTPAEAEIGYSADEIETFCSTTYGVTFPDRKSVV